MNSIFIWINNRVCLMLLILESKRGDGEINN